MQREFRLSKRTEFVCVFVFFNLVVWGVLLGLGTLTSGYHMVDDHEILEWVYSMRYQNHSLGSLITEILKRDLNMRFRPLYYTLRILGAYLFGINLTTFSIVNGAEIVLAMILLYYCGRQMGASGWSCGLFALTALVGYQSVVWWKLGPQESLGTMFFALGLWMMLKWLDNGKKIWAAGSLLVYFLMCNYKESYMLLLPFAGLYIVYDSIKKDEKLPAFSETVKRLKGKIWYIVCLILFFAYTALAVVLLVGATQYGGFNIKESLSLRGYYEVFSRSLDGDLKWYKFFTPVLIGILLTFWDDLKKMWKELLLLLAFIVPQFALYAQTGIGERYMLPCVVGYAWFFTVVVFSRKILSGKRKAVYTAALLLLLLANARAMIIEADYFRYRGESVTGMLETVEKLSNENDIKILSCFRPNEEGNLTVCYWQLVKGHDNVYYWTEESREINRVCDMNISYDPNDKEIFETYGLEEMDVVLMYNQKDRHYCYEPSLDASDFEVFDIGTMRIWIRKGTVPVPQMPDVKNYIYG